MKKYFKFTVFTPTYNRVHTLPRVYESLKAQTHRDFEWVIVDDGSTDGTSDYIEKLKKEAGFPIRYFWQENAGKHIAHNRGVDESQGEFFAILDSDDWYTAHALERFLYHWENIPKVMQPEFSGVIAQCARSDGSVIGNYLPKEVIDSNAIEIRTKYGAIGDKKGIIRTEILKEMKYPEFRNEKFVPDALIWNRMATRYQTRFVNEVLSFIEYLSDGYTVSSAKTRVLSPRGSSLYYKELAELNLPIPIHNRIKSYANYVRFCLHGNQGCGEIALEINSKALFLLGLPMGLLLWQRDKKSWLFAKVT